MDTGEDTKNYQAMINHIEEQYRFSAKVTPRDRREIQTHLPAWQSWQNTARAAQQSQKSGEENKLNNTIPDAIQNLLRNQIELYFNVVERGWNVAIQAREKNLYEAMGINHITESNVKKEGETKVYNIYNNRGKPNNGYNTKPSWVKRK